MSGVGIRLNLTIEHLEDLELALDAILERAEHSEEVTIALRVKDGEIETAIGPLRVGVRDELEATAGEDVGLRRILDTLVDRVDVAPGEGGEWVTLTKAVTEQDG